MNNIYFISAQIYLQEDMGLISLLIKNFHYKYFNNM